MTQSRSFLFICVNDLHAEQVQLVGPEQTLEPVDVGRAIESTLIPIVSGSEGVAYKTYKVIGEIGSKAAKFELYAPDGSHVASIAVCIKSISGPQLATWIANGNDFERPSAPWVAINCVDVDTAPEWVEYWAKCLGAGLIRRDGW